MKIKRPRPNRRTLRKRIARAMFISCLLLILLFGLAIYFLMRSIILDGVSKGATTFVSYTIATEMSSPSFPVQSLDVTTPGYEKWAERLESMSSISSFLNMDKMMMEEAKKDFNAGFEITADTDEFNVELDDMQIFFIKVQVGDRIIFNNMRSIIITADQDVDALYSSMDPKNQSVSPIKDAAGNTIGEVTVGILPEVPIIIITFIIILLLIFSLIALVVIKILSWLFTGPTIQPILELESKLKAFAQDDEQLAAQASLVVRKPLREVESLLESTNLIMQKISNQRNTLEDQFNALEKQHIELVASEQLLQETTSRLQQRERKLSSLLDHAGQGFLTFSSDLLIDPEYSKECEIMFKRDISGLNFAALMAMGDQGQQTFLEQLLTTLFREKNAGRREIYFSLMIDEIQIENRVFRMDYKVIPDESVAGQEKIMVIVTCITYNRVLEQQMVNERNMLKMIVKIVANYKDFTEIMSDFRNFYELEIAEIFSKSDTLKEKLSEVYRQLHTMKGNFSQYGLVHLTAKMHQAETQMSELLSRVHALTEQEARQFVDDLQMEQWSSVDLAVLRENLGEQFFLQEDLLLVDKARIVEIEKKMLSLLSPSECNLLLPELRKLRFRPFKDLFKSYPEYVMNVADRLEKPIHPFTIEGADFLANSDIYYEFGRSMIHVFRNMIDHGIESMDERAAAGKDETGSIRCAIERENEIIRITVSDDGRGLDYGFIRERAAAMQLLPNPASASESELTGLLFHPGFSTKDAVTDLSGRGVGLTSVKAEVDRLGGTIEVRSVQGEGTQFIFTLPAQEDAEFPEFTDPSMMSPVLDSASQFLQDTLRLDCRVSVPFHQLDTDKLHLRHITTFLHLKGAIEGMYVVSVDRTLAKQIVRQMVIDDLTEEEEQNLLEEALAETANVVIGNSVKWFRYFEDFVMMEPPISMSTEGASIKYADSVIWNSELVCCGEPITLALVMTRKGV
jgi:two-component system chemotaxis sensor kinase CheA